MFFCTFYAKRLVGIVSIAVVTVTCRNAKKIISEIEWQQQQHIMIP
jgi:hypothetical protein